MGYMRKKHRQREKRFIRLLPVVILCSFLSCFSEPAFSCMAADTALFSAYFSEDGLVLRTLPYYPPYHGIYAHRRHFLCEGERRTSQEMTAYMEAFVLPVHTIGEVQDRYISRCTEMLALLPDSIRYLFADYGWRFYVTAEDIAMTEFDGEYASVKGVTDVERLYIKVEDRDSATDTTILHEFGHFLDYCCDFPSEKNEFLTVMAQETDLAADMGMDYGLGDNEEYFAESFLWYLTEPEQMEGHIPLTYAFIARCLSETVHTVHAK